MKISGNNPVTPEDCFHIRGEFCGHPKAPKSVFGLRPKCGGLCPWHLIDVDWSKWKVKIVVVSKDDHDVPR